MRRLIFMMAISLMIISCKDSSKKATSEALKNSAKSKAANGKNTSATAKPYSIEIKAPKAAKVGEKVNAEIRLNALGEYKINAEYPIKLSVKALAELNPKDLIFAKKDAKTFEKKLVVFMPTHTPTKVGEFKSEAEFKFSVCTAKHCELKKQNITWITKVTQ